MAGFGHFKSEILAELRGVKYHDLEDMVYRMELPFYNFFDVFDIKYTSATSIGYTLPPGIKEVRDIDVILKSLLPDDVKINNTIVDTRLWSNLTTNTNLRFTEKSFFSIQFYDSFNDTPEF